MGAVTNTTHHPYKDPPPVGTKYGRWTVLKGPYSPRPKYVRILCRCDCGTTKEINYGHLREGRSTSCGCLSREKTIARSTKHGYSHHPLFSVWIGIRRRCFDPKDARFPWYGGRGITLEAAWRNDAGAFIEHVLEHLGERPDGLSMDRIDNDGNYEPGNLRWASPQEQIENSRRFLDGEVMQCASCARFISIDHHIAIEGKRYCESGCAP
jgi:hypothetical protein